MLRIALTGGIATGKSYVLGKLRARGIPCVDADELAHGVTAAGTEATAAIAARFGAEILGDDGAVNRARLGPIVFANPSARRELEAIVHPAIYRAIVAALRAFEMTGEYPIAVVDVPLLFESGGDKSFDRVIATVCSPDVQLARLRERGLSDEAAGQRLAAQLTAEEKAARAHFVIRTGGSFAETDRQIDDVVAALRTI